MAEPPKFLDTSLTELSGFSNIKTTFAFTLAFRHFKVSWLICRFLHFQRLLLHFRRDWSSSEQQQHQDTIARSRALCWTAARPECYRRERGSRTGARKLKSRAFSVVDFERIR